ncbi:VOC family protein [Actinoplanes sp. NPDC023714]|uniref:VOC family protein n=1 Tax=Actinoplanes sp. NPDC023714 TaxID=3154322 RepID=UPI0033F5A9EA
MHITYAIEGVSIAAADAARLAAFWGVALGDQARLTDHSRAIVRVTAGVPARSERTRVHFGVRLRADGPEDLLEAGGSVTHHPGPDPWYVLADPEGNEFTGWPPAEGRPPGVFELVVRCHGPNRLAHWWSRLLGGEVHDEGASSVVTGMTGFPWEFLVFQHEAEPKRAPNRIRWHVRLTEDGPEALLAVGAIVMHRLGGRQSGDDSWLMADPEGNEFVAHAARARIPEGFSSRPDGYRPVGGPAADRTPAAGLPAELPEEGTVKQQQADGRAERDDHVPEHAGGHAPG